MTTLDHHPHPSEFAPIVMPVHRRREHLAKVIAALQRNPECAATDLYIFSDASRGASEDTLVAEVREYLRTITGFRRVYIRERADNVGLAANISSAIDEVIGAHGRAIIVEDDIVVNELFLQFMNEALSFYSKDPRVWHISGWNYPVDMRGVGDAFLWRGMNCWGWATWADRWRNFRREPKILYEKYRDNKLWQQYFNLDGEFRFWSQVEDNYYGKISTWAIFWFATIIERNGLCLNPSVSYVRNIGIDGSGENSGTHDRYLSSLSNRSVGRWPTADRENADALALIKDFYRNARRRDLAWLVSTLRRRLKRRVL